MRLDHATRRRELTRLVSGSLADHAGRQRYAGRPVMVACWTTEVHAEHAPRTRLPVVAFETTGTLPDDPARQVVWVEIGPHKRPCVRLLGTKSSCDGRLLKCNRGQDSIQAACRRRCALRVAASPRVCATAEGKRATRNPKLATRNVHSRCAARTGSQDDRHAA
jgi:hypothetical protein